jgi:aldose 1-epimerase
MAGVTDPPSGQQFEIRHGDQRAVAVEVGGGLRLYERAGRAVVAGYAENEAAPASMGLPLVPWPNRLRDGRYPFGGRELQVPINEPERNNAIHGFGRSASWKASERRPESVTLTRMVEPTPGYPFKWKAKPSPSCGSWPGRDLSSASSSPPRSASWPTI